MVYCGNVAIDYVMLKSRAQSESSGDSVRGLKCHPLHNHWELTVDLDLSAQPACPTPGLGFENANE